LGITKRTQGYSGITAANKNDPLHSGVYLHRQRMIAALRDDYRRHSDPGVT
jgi:hypothetical protein